MGAFGSNPHFTIGGELSYNRIAELLPRDKYGALRDRYIYVGRSKNYALECNRHTHPITENYENAMCMRLYATDILQYFKDGTIVVDDYDSPVTRHCLHIFGPTPVYKCDGQRTFYDVNRTEWPMHEALVIRPDGTLHNVVKVYKHHKKLKPGRRKERKDLRAMFLEGATGRLLLGEFPEIVVRSGCDWMAYVPTEDGEKRRMFQDFCFKADHEKIMSCMGRSDSISSWSYGMRRDPHDYDSPERAVKAVMDRLMQAALGGEEWYDRSTTTTEHRDIQMVRR